ncbi:hypothetical protein HYS31_06710 [Candidatus Woesearchaeota archaeon]|nr:hypothetical protein [Candidatus Woesearchaeota archaeon]
MPLGSELKTIADELLELVRQSKRISVEEAAKKLNIPLSTAQDLVDFLVEEKVFGIEFKFTTPYVYLYKEGISKAKAKSRNISQQLATKELFYEKAKEKGVPHEYIEGLWRKYLQQNIAAIKEEFLKKSRKNGIPESRIEQLWKKYLSYL